MVGARRQHRAAQRDDAGDQVGTPDGEAAGEHPAEAVADDLDPGAAAQGHRLQPRLELGGGVERAADVGVDERAVGAVARSPEHPRHRRERAVAGQEARAPAPPAPRAGWPRDRRTTRGDAGAGARGAEGEAVRPRRRRCASRSTATARGGRTPPGAGNRQRRCRHAFEFTPTGEVLDENIAPFVARFATMRLTGLMSAGSVLEIRTPEVAVSDELFAPVGHGVELCYQTFGDPDGDPLLLVMGLGGPMTWWDPAFCRLLARAASSSSATTTATPAGPPRCRGRVSRAMLVRASPGAGCGRRTRWATWPRTPSACSTTSASTPPTWSASRWAA